MEEVIQPFMDEIMEQAIDDIVEFDATPPKRADPNADGGDWDTDSENGGDDAVVVPAALPDSTVLFEDPLAATASCIEPSASSEGQPVLSLVSLNTRTAASVDILRGTLSVLPELPRSSDNSAVRTVRISCGRGPGNTIKLKDSRVSLHHFTVRVRAAAGGRVVLDLLDQSTNGTWVDGKRVGRGRRVTLSVGVRIVALPSTLVGKEGEVGYVLLQDTKGAHCNPAPASAQEVPRPLASSSSSSESPAGFKGLPKALEEDLRCGICTDVLHRCLTLVPCGHNFCALCLAKWRRRSMTCPGCREPVRQAVQNLDVDRIVQTFVRAHPEAARSSEEEAALERGVCEPESAAHLRSLLRDRVEYERRVGPPHHVASPQRHGVRQARPQSGQAVRQPQRGTQAGASQARPNSATSEARRPEYQQQSVACVIC